MQSGKLRKKKIVAGPLVREVVYAPPTKWDTPQSRKEREEASTAAREATTALMASPTTKPMEARATGGVMAEMIPKIGRAHV